ncbi:MAG: MauE/DoxX family redox-associated membrane protein [Gammaproteobacteria bacterium]
MVEPMATAFAVTLLVVVFLAASVNKLRSLEIFEGVVYNFRLLPETLVKPVAYSLPFVEMAVAATLIVPATRSYSSWTAVILLGVFTLAVAINLLRGRREIDCGCFSPGHKSSDLKQTLSWWLVLRNMVLAGLALWVAAAPAVAPVGTGLEWLLGMVTAIIVAIFYVTAARLAMAARYHAALGANAMQHGRVSTQN